MEALQNYINDANVVELLIGFGFKLILAILIYVVGKWIGRIVQKVLEKMLRRKEMDEVLVDFLGTISYAVVMAVAIVAAIDTLGIPATSLVAVLGAAGLAIGLALKDSLSNFAAGVMLVVFRPFTKGDFIDAAGESGTVEEVFLVSTVLKTPDNKVITVPNGLVWGGTITNYSANDTRRLDMVFGVGYDDDLKVTADVLMKICKENDKVLKDKDIGLFVANLGDSSVDFAVRPWVKTEDYWAAKAEITERAKVALEEAGCSIPYPQRDVHTYIHNGDGGSD